jgi:FKBP-type peptidyl-prolyl cis-trans isomerase FkpA
MKQIAILFITIILFSCQDDDSNINYDKQNETDIVNYISTNNLTAQKTASGLYYVIDNPGQGAQPNINSTVRVSYKGYFTNGEVFDQSNASGISFGLQQVIQGWTEGIQLFKEGGSGKLLIPSRLGYGSKDNRSIPGGSVLIFDITLLEVQ